MSSPTQDYVGQAGDPTTQGLGRLVGQYAQSSVLATLLGGIYAMANDLELLGQRVGRMMSLTDDITYTPDSGVTYPVNSRGAQGAQLQGIARVVGVTNVVPAAGLATGLETLEDWQFRLLIVAKIYRNYVRGGTIPQLIKAIQLIMPDLTTTGSLIITEIGHMTVLVAVGRFVANTEAGIFALPSGQNNLKGAILPRPSGIALMTYWQNAGCFCFSSSTNQGVPLFTGGLGFNSDPASTTGHWARSF